MSDEPPVSDEPTDSENTDHTLVSTGLPSTRDPSEEADDEPTKVKREPIRVIRARSETPPSSDAPPPSSGHDYPPSSSPAVELNVEPRERQDSSIPIDIDDVEEGARPFSASADGLPRLWLTRSALKLPTVTELEESDLAPRSSTVSAAVDQAVNRARADRSTLMRVKQRQRWGVILAAFGVGCVLTGILVALLVRQEEVHLQLEVDPPDAEVYVDGQRMTGVQQVDRPCSREVELRVEAEGYQSETQEIGCGETVRMVIRLKKMP